VCAIKLDKSIWQSTEFKEYAASNLILERADFPKKNKTIRSESQNKMRTCHDNKEALVVVLDSKGKVLGRLATKRFSNEYIALLNSFIK
jgi:hypothetical protein